MNKKLISIPELHTLDDVRQVLAKTVNDLQTSIISQLPIVDYAGERIQNVGAPQAADDVVTLKFLQSGATQSVQPTSIIAGGSNTTTTITGGGGGWASLFPDIVSPLNPSWTVLNTGNSFSQAFQGGSQQVINIWQAGTPTNFLLNCLLKSIPSTPYIIDLGFANSMAFTSSTVGGDGAGLILRDSATDHVVTFQLNSQTPGSSNARIQSWNATTGGAGTFNADYLGTGTSYFNPAWLFFRISDDGVTRKFFVSNDNKFYSQIFSHASGTYITPNQVGFYILSGNTGQPAGILVFHYKEH